MATFNLVINYPDEQGPRIMAALKSNWTTRDMQGNAIAVPTNAEAIEHLRQEVVRLVKNTVRRVESEAAVAQAAAGVTTVDAT